jgi:Tfp pilus assembly protein PilF
MSFAILWFAVTIAPVLNPRWLAANVFTERYLYLPSVAFCWLVAGLWVSLWRRGDERQARRRRALVAGLALVSALYVLRIVTRMPDWRDDVTLYTKTLEVSPASYHIRNNLGTVYWKHGNIAAAEREWQRAHALAPRNAIFLNNLGLIHTYRKDYDTAREYFWRAIRLKPNYTDPHLNLGVAYLEQDEYERAELQLRAAVALSPLNVYARRKIAELFVETGRLEEAEEHYRRGAESQQDFFAYKGLGMVYRMRKQPEQAEKALLRARELDPFDSEVRFELAELYLASGRTAEALSEYRTGLETDPRNEKALEMVRKLTGSGPSGD